MSERRILDADDVRRALTRIAHEIVERDGSVEDLVLVGIRSRGVPMAQRLAALIEQHEGASVPIGSVDITYYRDDLTRMAHAPIVERSDLEVEVRRTRIVILVDDVLHTARPVQARPRCPHPDHRRPRAVRARDARRPGPPRATDTPGFRRQEPTVPAQNRSSTCRSRRPRTVDKDHDRVSRARRVIVDHHTAYISPHRHLLDVEGPSPGRDRTTPRPRRRDARGSRRAEGQDDAGGGDRRPHVLLHRPDAVKL